MKALALSSTICLTVYVALYIAQPACLSYPQSHAYPNNVDAAKGISGTGDMDLIHSPEAMLAKRKMANAFAKQGFSYRKAGDYKAALAYYEKAIEIDPNNPLAKYSRGEMWLTNGQNEDAIKDFDVVLSQTPVTTGFYYRGLAHFRLGNVSQAVQDFSSAIDLSPNDSFNFFLRAKGRFILKDYPAAIVDLLRALYLDLSKTSNSLRLEISLACTDLWEFFQKR